MKKLILSLFFVLGVQMTMFAQTDIKKLFDQAQMAVEMGYLDDAIGKYEQILEANPQFAKAYLALGQIYIKKGTDVNSMQNAIRCYSKYLQLVPTASDAADVRTAMNKLEFMLDKAVAADQARIMLCGRWASTLTKSDEAYKSAFILDISELDGKLQIDLEPTSFLYSDKLLTRRVYIDDPSAEEWEVVFSSEQNYIPSEPGKAVAHQTVDAVMPNSLGGALGSAILHGLIESGQAKKTIIIYQLKIRPVPGEDKFSCVARLFKKEITQQSEKVLQDETFETSFYKVNSNFDNSLASIAKRIDEPIEISSDGTFAQKGVNRAITSYILSNHPDPEISHLYNDGLGRIGFGGFLIGFAGGGGLAGAIVCYSKGKPTWGTVLMVGSVVSTIFSIKLIQSGIRRQNSAAAHYNEWLPLRYITEASIGWTGTGIGLNIMF